MEEPGVVTEGVMEAARNLVRDYIEVQSGQEVLIHTEPGYDHPNILEALMTAVGESGGVCSLLRTPNWSKQTEPPPAVVRHAIQGADILIGQGEYLHTKNPYLQKAVFEDGLVYINSEAKTPEAFGSLYGRFPAHLLFDIGMRVIDKLDGDPEVRVTTKAGTDITMRVAPETVGGYCYPFGYDTPGHKKGFPGGVVALHPEDPVQGVIAAEALTPRPGIPKALLDEPLWLMVENHRVVDVKGDCSDWLKNHWAENGDENSGWLAECSWGIHPKASADGGRGASNPHLLHFGLGNSIPYGGPVFSSTWIVVFVGHPTVSVNGEEIMTEGKLNLLSDPSLIQIAETHSNGTELLSQVPTSIADSFRGR